jgi:hypothetical protein
LFYRAFFTSELAVATALDTAEVAAVLAAVASLEKNFLTLAAIDGQNTPNATPAAANKIECINLLWKKWILFLNYFL